MTYRELVRIALIILGVLQAPTTVYQVTNTIAGLVLMRAHLPDSQLGQFELAASCLGPAFLIVFNYLLLFASKPLAAIFIREDRQLDWSQVASTQLVAGGCTIVGVLLIAMALSDLGALLAEHYGYSHALTVQGSPSNPIQGRLPFYGAQFYAGLGTCGVRFVLGLLLVVGKKRLVALWRALRTAGHDRNEENA